MPTGHFVAMFELKLSNNVEKVEQRKACLGDDRFSNDFPS